MGYTLTEEQRAYIDKQLEPYCFKDIDTSDFCYWAGMEPAKAIEIFKAALDDFASMLDIAKSDIGMNGHITLKMGINPKDASLDENNYNSGYANMSSNILAMRAYNAQSFAHEWGHLVDKLIAHHNRGVAFDGKQKVAFSDYYIFPHEFVARTKEYYKDAPEIYHGYLMNRNEMFARMVEMIPSTFCINPDYDLTVLARDARDVELLELEDIKPVREDQDRVSLNGIPCPSTIESTEFLQSFLAWMNELKQEGIFHETDCPMEDVLQKEIVVEEDVFDKVDDFDLFYMNADDYARTMSMLEGSLAEYEQEFNENVQNSLDEGMSLDDALDKAEEIMRSDFGTQDQREIKGTKEALML